LPFLAEVAMPLVRGLLTSIVEARDHLISGRFRLTVPGSSALAALGLAGLNILTNIGATTAFAVSGRSETFRTFLIWQIMGSAFGLGTQLTFAGLVRFTNVQLASAVGIGLAFLSAEVFTSFTLFKETFSRIQWAGVAAILLGLMLVIWGGR
jgi:drug/metabolite transporter (DMT)-like permease